MKFLVDAQLPARLVAHLVAAGHEAMHTRELSKGNRTVDEDIAAIADRENSVVVTKDGDFTTSHHLSGKPRRLLLIATGNLSNDDLFRLIDGNLPGVVEALEKHSFVELSQSRLTVHD